MRLWRSIGFVALVCAIVLPAAAQQAASAGAAVVVHFESPAGAEFLRLFDSEIRQPLRRSLPAGTTWMLREQFAVGQEFPRIYQVELEGNCSAVEFVDHASRGPLGWVFYEGGRIHPQAFVDCDRIAASLSAITYAMPRQQRRQLMARAVARVLVHELTHIETQREGHTPHSLQQAALTPVDLIAEKLPGGI